MKQFYSAVFCLFLILSFTGCSAAPEQMHSPTPPASIREEESETLKAIRHAEALEQAGLHQEAMEVLEQLVGDQVPVSQPEPEPHTVLSPETSPESVPTEVPASVSFPASPSDSLVGTWKALSGKTVWEFYPDGMLTIKKIDPADLVIRVNRTCPYEFDGSTVTIDGTAYSLSVSQDGAQILTGPEGSTSFVRDDSFSKAVIEIPITLDNWQAYFELRSANDVALDKQGKIIELRPGFGLFLRDAYVPRYIDGDTVFTCRYTKIDMDYQWAPGTVDYSFQRKGEYLLNDGSHYDCRISDMRPLNLPESSDYAGSVSVPVGCGELILPEGQTTYPESVEILSVFGSIILAKE